MRGSWSRACLAAPADPARWRMAAPFASPIFRGPSAAPSLRRGGAVYRAAWQGRCGHERLPDPGHGLRRVGRRNAVVLLLLCLAVPLAGVLAAPPTRQQIQEADRARAAQLAAGRAAAERLAAAQAEAKRLADARVATTADLRGLENATADAATTMDALAKRRAAAQIRLAERAADLGPLLPLIERMALYPAETLLAVPARPEATLRGLLVLKGLARQIEADAEALRAEQADVDRLTAQMSAQERRLSTAQAAQATKASALDRQIADAQARGRDAEDAAAEANRRAAEQAAKADSLRAALAQLDAARRLDEARARAEAAQADRKRQATAAEDARRRAIALAQPAGPGLDDAHGQLGAPVAGTVVRAFGEPSDAGPASGISYQAPPAARVSSPCAGRVVFAGPFRSYGLLLILDCGGGYNIVLAGLARLDVQVGRPVQAGEPVGVMPGGDPHIPGQRPVLYVEVRHNGLAINPTPFLRARS
jgi:septal ring factor EnvC (AmiA/AmiB activator)